MASSGFIWDASSITTRSKLMSPTGRNFASDRGDIMKQGLSARMARPARVIRCRTGINLFSFPNSFRNSSRSVQEDLGPTLLPTGGETANSFPRTIFRSLSSFWRSRSAKVRRFASSVIPVTSKRGGDRRAAFARCTVKSASTAATNPSALIPLSSSQFSASPRPASAIERRLGHPEQ